MLLWEYEITAISQQATLQVDFTFGPPRENGGHIWAIINRRTLANKYHFNYLLPEHWRTHKTKFAIAEHGKMCDYRELIKYVHQQQEDVGRPMTEFYSGLRILLIEFGNVKPEQCERIFINTGQCQRAINHAKCTSATGPLTLAMVRPDVTPDLHNNQSILAYGRPCFLNTNTSHTELNETEGTSTRNKRFIFALLFSAMMGGIVENDMKNYFDTHLKTYNRILNDRIEGLAAEMNSGFSDIQDQLQHVREAQNQLETQVHMLAIVTENYHQIQECTNRVQYAVDKQLLENTVANTKAILETRQIALTEGNEDAKRAILDFHLHRRILLMLKDLRPVQGLMNYTVYKTNIRQGIMENEALYWFGKNETEFIRRWNNTDRINALRRNLNILEGEANEELQRLPNLNNQSRDDQEILERIENATLSHLNFINFTIGWNPITLNFKDSNWTGGAEKILNKVLNFGGKVVDDVSGIINNVVDKGADVIEHTEDTATGFFSEPIKIIIISIASIIGIILILITGSFAWRYVKTGKKPDPKKALRLAAAVSGVTPVTEIAGGTLQKQTKPTDP